MGVICSGDVIVICQVLDALGADMADVIGVEQKEREHYDQQQNGHDEHKHHLLIALIDVVGRNHAHQIPVVIAKRVDGSPVLPSGILKRERVGALRGNGLLEFFTGLAVEVDHFQEVALFLQDLIECQNGFTVLAND